jgi:hypothetical protein
MHKKNPLMFIYGINGWLFDIPVLVNLTLFVRSVQTGGQSRIWDKLVTGSLILATLLSVVFLFYYQNFGQGFKH